MFPLPPQIHMVLQRLEQAGFAAYLVGGWVRDCLRGAQGTDFDIATSALPEQVKTLFSDLRVIETGIRHGTVTVLVQTLPVEITTFRIEQTYTDHRHPDQVTFTRSLREDLARRDFTVNALAYHPEQGIVDYFGGVDDLKQGILRCVGDADTRLQEDGLRIMRALRFCATLGLTLDPDTEAALHRQREQLRHVSAERLAAELIKLLCGPGAGQVILRHTEILGVFLPELLPMRHFDQRNPHHVHDLLNHTVRVVDHVPAQPALRLAALLHDVAKPDCFTLDEAGVGHFYGHDLAGAAMAETILTRLRLDKATCRTVCALVSYHMYPIDPDPRAVRRALARLTPELYFPLLQLKQADNSAKNPDALARVEQCRQAGIIARQILAEQPCLTREQLALNGRDLAALGVAPGKRMGQMLQALLDQVLAQQLPNEKEALLDYVKTHLL